jgi:hypothetical protein
LKRRVVVTGLGLVLPNGIGVEEAWRNTCEGRSGVGPITRFDTSQFETKIAGEVKGFNPEDYVERKEVRRMDLFIQYAVAAGRGHHRDGFGGASYPRGISQSSLGEGSEEDHPILHTEVDRQYGRGACGHAL